MYFYNYFIYLCNEKDVAPSRAAVEVGLSKTAVNGWKTGKSLPTDANLQLLASYFEIPVVISNIFYMVRNVRFIGILGDSGNFSGVILRLNWYALLSVSNRLVTKKKPGSTKPPGNYHSLSSTGSP